MARVVHLRTDGARMGLLKRRVGMNLMPGGGGGGGFVFSAVLRCGGQRR